MAAFDKEPINKLKVPQNNMLLCLKLYAKKRENAYLGFLALRGFVLGLNE